MKKIHAVLIIIISSLLLISLHHGNSESVTNGFPTQITMVGNTQLTVNQATSFNISVREPNNNLSPFGYVDVISASTVKTLGKRQFSQSANLTSPKITWTASENLNISGFRIPVNKITIPQQIEWKLVENGNNVIIGQIGGTEARQMVKSTSSIWLIFGTVQTSGNIYGNNYYSIKFGKTYSLELNIGSTSQSNSFVFPLGTVDSPVLEDLTTNKTYNLSFQLIHKNSFVRQSSSLDAFQVPYTPLTTGTKWMVAYYSGVQSLFLPSINFSRIEVFPDINSNASLSDVTVMQKAQGTLTSSFEVNGIPVYQAVVSFYIFRNDFWIELGQNKTDYGGIAQYKFIADIEQGTYPIKAVVHSSGTEIVSLASLSVIPPTGKIMISSAEGNYGSGIPENSSIVTIVGQVNSDWGQPLADIPLELHSANGPLLGTSATDQLGRFSFQYLHNGSVGFYPSQVYVSAKDPVYQIPDMFVDVTIKKGTLSFIFDTLPSYEFMNSSLIIAGNLVKSNGVGVNLPISLLFYDTTAEPFPTWVAINTTTTINGSFEFITPNPGVGQARYLVSFNGDNSFNPIQNEITFNVKKSTAYLNSPNLFTPSDPITIYYNHLSDFSVVLKASDGTPVSNALVKWYTPSLNGSPSEILLFSAYTDNSGLATFFWHPSDSFIDVALALQLSGQHPFLKITATHENFTVPDLKVFWQIQGLNISASLVPSSYYYSFSQQIQFTVVDSFGENVVDGLPFTLVILGTNLKGYSSGGVVSFDLIFNTTGSIDISLFFQATNTIYSFPYGSLFIQSTIAVSPADVNLVSMDYTGMQGEEILLEVSATNLQNRPLDSVSLELWYYAGFWRKVNANPILTNSSGYASFLYLIDLPTIGEYSFEWRVSPNANFTLSSSPFILTVSKIITKIEVAGSHEYNFSQQASLDIRLSTALNVSIPQKEILFSMGSYSWSEVTSISGQVSTTLPAGIAPGNYSLSISFSGDKLYNASSLVWNISVLGTPSSITVSGMPAEAIYSKELNFTVLLTDGYGNPLANEMVIIRIANNTYLGTTAGDGKYFFSQPIFENSSEIQITIEFNGNVNYVNSSKTIILPVKKIALSGYVFAENPLFGIPNNFTFFVNSSIGKPVSNVSVKVYIVENQETLLAEGKTTSNGYFSFNGTIDLPAGSVFTIRVIFTHENYSSDAVTRIFEIKRAPILFTVTTGNYSAFMPSLIIIHVVDVSNAPLEGLQVTISYNFGQKNYLIGQTMSTNEGYAIFEFNPPFAGDLYLIILIEDLNGNYLQGNGTIPLVISKATAGLSLSTSSSTDFQPVLVASLNSSVNVPVNVSFEVYSNGQWILIGTQMTVNNQSTVVIPQEYISETWMQFRATIVSADFVNSSATLLINLKNVVIDPLTPLTVQLGDYVIPQIKLNTSNTPNYFYFNLYYLASNNEQILWGTVFVINGTYLIFTDYGFYSVVGVISETNVSIMLNSIGILLPAQQWLSLQSNVYSLPLNLSLGMNDFLAVFPEQGWFRQASIQFQVNVILESLSINGGDLNLQPDNSTTIVVSVTDDDGMPVSNIDIYLQIYMNGNWLTIGNATINNGVATIAVNPSLPYGVYTLRYLIPKQDIYAMAIIEKSLTISKQTSLQLISPSPIEITYSDPVTIIVLLTEGDVPVSNKTIMLSVFSGEELLNQYYSVTNGSGYAVFSDILSDLVPGANYTITIDFLGDSALSPSSLIIHDVSISRENVEVSLVPSLTVDYGPTFNQTIAVTVKDESGIISVGQVYWTVYYQNEANVWLPLDGWSGFIALPETGIIVFTFNFTGNFQLYVEYVNDNPYYVGDDGFVYEFGWSPTSPQLKETEVSVAYSNPINFTLHLQTQDGTPLRNIHVLLITTFGNYSAISTDMGILYFSIPNMDVGTFNVSLLISQQMPVMEATLFFSLSISPIQQGFSAQISDNYWDELLSVSISDPLNSTAQYTIIFKVNGSIVWISENLTYSKLAMPFKNPYPSPATIEFIIIRYSQFSSVTNATGSFTLIPIPVQFKIDYGINASTANVNITIIDKRNNNLLFIPYILQISNGTHIFSLEVNDYSLSIPLTSSSLNLTFSVSGKYVGFTTVNLSPDAGNDLGDASFNGLVGQSSTDIFAIFLLIAGAGVITLIQKKKK